MKKRILIVEDEENFGALLKNYLELSNFEVIWAKNGAEAYSIVMQKELDLCILDVMLPHIDGFQLGEKIKQKKPTPFFYLTAKNQKEDVINGYKIGADDYLTKPFDTDVLLLKIKALLNRTNQTPEAPETKAEYTVGTYRFEPQNRTLYHPSGDRKLSPKEAVLLDLLCRYEGQIMPREIALTNIWQKNDYFTRRSMDVYIGKLRKHLAGDQRIRIETFHQMGFQLSISTL